VVRPPLDNSVLHHSVDRPPPLLIHGHINPFVVAQVCNLLYRRIAFCESGGTSGALYTYSTPFHPDFTCASAPVSRTGTTPARLWYGPRYDNKTQYYQARDSRIGPKIPHGGKNRILPHPNPSASMLFPLTWPATLNGYSGSPGSTLSFNSYPRLPRIKACEGGKVGKRHVLSSQRTDLSSQTRAGRIRESACMLFAIIATARPAYRSCHPPLRAEAE
jgi:hypothetical protein